MIYRRVDDDFLDPLAFRPDSMLGVPGLFAAYRAGRVTLANAIGTGVADDKSIYPYVPDMIRFYLARGADPQQRADLAAPPARRVATTCSRTSHELVVKEVHGAGGYGMLIGPAATRRGARGLPRAHPRRARTSTSRSRRLRCRPARRSSASGLAPRHIDLRPYVLSGKHVTSSRAASRASRCAKVAGRELVAGRGHEGHVGRRR